MSSLIPSGSASGTGSMTLAAPVTNSNQTATLPDATGTVMVSGNMPAFSAYQSTAQSISATLVKLTMDTKEFDTANCYSTTNYRFTPLVAGYYQVNGNLSFASSNSSTLISLYKNGVRFKDGGLGGTLNSISSVLSTLVYLNGSTDYIEVYGYQSAGFPINTVAGSYFQAILVRAA